MLQFPTLEVREQPARSAEYSLSPPTVLRLSVTDRCNFRCLYCQPQLIKHNSHAAGLPSLEELGAAVKWLAQVFPLRSVKLTGGEPLVRQGVGELVSILANFCKFEDISLTTNGSRLGLYARTLRQAGLQRVNVSLDTLNPERFYDLTGGSLKDTLAGIVTARAEKLSPIKLNAVLRRSTWREEVPNLLDYAGENSLEIRFIELMSSGSSMDWVGKEFISAQVVRAWLGEQTRLETWLESTPAPARRLRVDWRGSKLVVGWITPRSECFCAGCNRLRLNARGCLYRCLMDPTYFPLIENLRTGSSAEVAEGVRTYLYGKRLPTEMKISNSMVAIGA